MSDEPNTAAINQLAATLLEQQAQRWRVIAEDFRRTSEQLQTIAARMRDVYAAFAAAWPSSKKMGPRGTR